MSIKRSISFITTMFISLFSFAHNYKAKEPSSSLVQKLQSENLIQTLNITESSEPANCIGTLTD
ncbi:hypothetical protein A11Q_909 [Pseudobdellovibrio exovorus JSS]|uniref:Uncharacterized protein n=1 Tax=Pseudobdellovibrio exovorus JSS TaxID=1184267 RepID=M4V9K5_9BACT|nr:hypothetical protein A11Q_909 [Pseudobdellovibrio exovorus JSS]